MENGFSTATKIGATEEDDGAWSNIGSMEQHWEQKYYVSTVSVMWLVAILTKVASKEACWINSVCAGALNIHDWHVLHPTFWIQAVCPMDQWPKTATQKGLYELALQHFLSLQQS